MAWSAPPNWLIARNHGYGIYEIRSDKFISRGGAAWSARMAHNHQVVGSNPTPATKLSHRPKDGVLICHF